MPLVATSRASAELPRSRQLPTRDAGRMCLLAPERGASTRGEWAVFELTEQQEAEHGQARRDELQPPTAGPGRRTACRSEVLTIFTLRVRLGRVLSGTASTGVEVRGVPTGPVHGRCRHRTA